MIKWTPISDEVKWATIEPGHIVVWSPDHGFVDWVDSRGETISRAINQLHNDGGLIEAFRRNP